jgi:uncharacterized protein (TIGR02421 family)
MNCESHSADIIRASQILYEASRSVRILTSISWPVSVRESFFERGESELPQVEYPRFDQKGVFEKISAARRHFSGPPAVVQWLEKIASRLETSAQMLANCGRLQFTYYSQLLYGAPRDDLADEENSSLDLALRFDALFDRFNQIDLGKPLDSSLSSDDVASEMRNAAVRMFGDQSPEVCVVDELSANALAGPGRIRIRRGARFSDKDVRQLIFHEAQIHVATSLNGINQPYLKILAAPHPGTTRTQEGLAVFAEFITGSIDLERFRRLADRVIAIQMALDGADFLDIYRFFLERTDDKIQAFENARRVFRGGDVRGSAPFTKDIVYLDGLLRVHNFLRTMVSAGRPDCLRLIFVGKLDLEDIPVLAMLMQKGLCDPPKFLPAWASDIRFLLCYLTYSSFLNNIDLSKVRKKYQNIIESLPPFDRDQVYRADRSAA